MRNPFKKTSIAATIVNVGIGGAANVAMDYARANVDALASLSDTVYNLIKIGVGALGGSMTSNKYIRAGVDGIATVGAANLISEYIGGEQKATSGAPFIGHVRAGQRGYIRKVRGKGAAGTGTVPFMQA